MKAEQRLSELRELLRGSPYEPKAWLGRGAVADVFIVRHGHLGKEFALKIIHPHLVQAPGYVERLRREARSLGKMDPTHVVRVVDFATSTSGAPYLVLERMKGGTLAHELSVRGRPPLQQALAWADAILRGLASAHRLGVVHRDLSPDNVFLKEVRGAERQLKILDFGLAGVLPGAPDSSIKGALSTSTGTLVGSPGYASPEALSGQKVDTRADIYSAGVVLFELLTGLGPFDIDEVGIPAPSRFIELPGELDAVVARATQVDPAGRYQTAEDFRLALSPFRDDGTKP